MLGKGVGIFWLGGRTYEAALLLAGGDLADVEGRAGAVAAGFVSGGGGEDGAAVAGVGREEVGDVAVREVGEVGLNPGDQVVLGYDVGGGD